MFGLDERFLRQTLGFRLSKSSPKTLIGKSIPRLGYYYKTKTKTHIGLGFDSVLQTLILTSLTSRLLMPEIFSVIWQKYLRNLDATDLIVKNNLFSKESFLAFSIGPRVHVRDQAISIKPNFSK